MRSLATRLTALEEHFAVHGCTCEPIVLVHQQFDDPLSDEEVRARTRAKSDCVVHPGEPASLIVVINRFTDGAAHEVV